MSVGHGMNRTNGGSVHGMALFETWVVHGRCLSLWEVHGRWLSSWEVHERRLNLFWIGSTTTQHQDRGHEVSTRGEVLG